MKLFFVCFSLFNFINNNQDNQEQAQYSGQVSPTKKNSSQQLQNYSKSPVKAKSNLQVSNTTSKLDQNEITLIQSLQSSPQKALSPTKAFKAHEETAVNSKESKRMAKQQANNKAQGDPTVTATKTTTSASKNNNKEESDNADDDDDDVFVEPSKNRENAESDVSVVTTTQPNKTTDIKPVSVAATTSNTSTVSRDSNVVGDTANR